MSYTLLATSRAPPSRHHLPTAYLVPVPAHHRSAHPHVPYYAVPPPATHVSRVVHPSYIPPPPHVTSRPRAATVTSMPEPPRRASLPILPVAPPPPPPPPSAPAPPLIAIPSPHVTPAPPAPAPGRLPAQNTVRLTRELLRVVLHDLSAALLARFGHQVALLVHGGVVAVLHPDLGQRAWTRDVDFIQRAFVADYAQYGVHDAAERLREAIRGVAVKHGLGLDWMNADPDVALPMAATDARRTHTYDPIRKASLSTTPSPTTTSIAHRTLYSGPGLRLIAIDWTWALALKFVRYAKSDPLDACAIVRLLYWQTGTTFDTRTLEERLARVCWPMGYEAYPRPKLEELRLRIRDCLGNAFEKRPGSRGRGV